MVVTHTGCLLCLVVSVHCVSQDASGCPVSASFRGPHLTEVSPSCNGHHSPLLPISSLFFSFLESAPLCLAQALGPAGRF